MLFSRTQKIVKLTVTAQMKKLWLLALNLAKNNFWGFKEISNISLSTWNLYLREIIFVTDIAILTIETFLIERKARV